MQRRAAGRQAASLLLAAGGLTLVNNYMPGSEHLDVAALNLVGVLAIVAGAVSWFVPWHRLPAAATLVHAPLALGLIVAGNALGGVGAYSYAVYFVVVFVWVGLSQPPRTAWLLVPPAAAAYVGPLLAREDTGVGGVSSATVAIPVCVLVAETIARTTQRHRLAQEDALRRAQLSERLLAIVGDINATLDPDAVLPRICDGVRQLVGVAGAGFVTAKDGVAAVVAVSGISTTAVGVEYPVTEGLIGDVLRTGRRVVSDADHYPLLLDEVRDAVPGLHEIVALPTIAGGTVGGALYALVGEERPALLPAELDALEALAGHVGAALRNAAGHAELVRRQAHEQAVIDGMADGMAVVGSDGTVTSWNAAAERLTGIASVAAVGRPPPFGSEPGVAVTYRTPDGRWLEVVGSPLDDGELVVVGIRDVSAAKALDEAKDLFLATTSHELRTPLTVVKGYTATLRRRWPDLPDAVRAEALQVIADRTDSLIDLVDHLLLSARADASRHSLTPVPLLLEPLLEQAARQTTVISPRHPVRVDVAPDLAALADATALGQVLGQLLENAVKYSPEGGPIDLRARSGGGEVVVTVADRGTGLRPGSERAVFERFVQGHQGDSRAFGGVGLGLHIVRNLVEAMHGSVHAARRVGGGAEFSFNLPAALVAVPQPRETHRHERSPGGERTDPPLGRNALR